MKLQDILSKVDHTLLSPAATWDEIKAICDDGMRFKTASVCIPASYVKTAKEYVGDRLPICTVIGFPCGYSTTAVKCFEVSEAKFLGALTFSDEKPEKQKLIYATLEGGK